MKAARSWGGVGGRDLAPALSEGDECVLAGVQPVRWFAPSAAARPRRPWVSQHLVGGWRMACTGRRSEGVQIGDNRGPRRRVRPRERIAVTATLLDEVSATTEFYPR